MLRQIRLEKGLSVPKLSELSGISRRTIQDIEKRGDALISNIAVLAKALNVPMNEIWKE